MTAVVAFTRAVFITVCGISLQSVALATDDNFKPVEDGATLLKNLIKNCNQAFPTTGGLGGGLTRMASALS